MIAFRISYAQPAPLGYMLPLLSAVARLGDDVVKSGHTDYEIDVLVSEESAEEFEEFLVDTADDSLIWAREGYEGEEEE